MINLDYRDARCLHEQIADGFRELIVNGIMLPDEQLPSVRELSVSLTVNPNTVQKAYKELELGGYIYSVKGKGNFVSQAKDIKTVCDTHALYKALEESIRELMFLGEDRSKLDKLIDDIYLKKEEKR